MNRKPVALTLAIAAVLGSAMVLTASADQPAPMSKADTSSAEQQAQQVQQVQQAQQAADAQSRHAQQQQLRDMWTRMHIDMLRMQAQTARLFHDAFGEPTASTSPTATPDNAPATAAASGQASDQNGSPVTAQADDAAAPAIVEEIDIQPLAIHPVRIQPVVLQPAFIDPFALEPIPIEPIPIEPMARVPEQQMQVSVKEEKDDYVVKANMPGVDQDNFKVQLSGRLLSIDAQSRATEKLTAENGDVLSEQHFTNRVRQALVLPGPVDSSGLKKDFANGVLTLTLPKANS